MISVQREIQKFLTTVAGKPGFKVVKDPSAYPYHVEETRMNTDPFVRKAMKLWSPEIYESSRGYTKRGRLSDALETLSKYSRSEKTKKFKNEKIESCVNRAILKARKVFIPSDKLHRYSLAFGTDSMNLDAAAGFSYPGQKKCEVVEEAYDVAAYMQHRIQRGMPTYKAPCKLAIRGHLSPEDERKSRPVWVYPFEVSILEAKWAIPFYEHLENNVDEVHFGKDSMPKLAKLLMGGISGHDECAEVTLDWSAFDSSISNFLINEAFSIIWDSFDNEYAFHEGSAVFGGEVMVQKNKKLFQWIKEYFIKTKIMMPNGVVLQKQHGIPSGSFFTQAVGSIVNYIMVVALSEYFGWNARRVRILGDDSSFLIPLYNPKNCRAEDISQMAWEMFGVTLKHEKLRIATKDCERKFLGYQVRGYRLFRDEDEWFKLVLYPERDVESLEQSVSRVLAYYLLGGINNVNYCDFFWDYLSRYPSVIGRELRISRGIKRMFKYVLRQSVDVLRVPDFGKLDMFRAPYLFTAGDAPFKESTETPYNGHAY